MPNFLEVFHGEELMEKNEELWIFLQFHEINHIAALSIWELDKGYSLLFILGWNTSVLSIESHKLTTQNILFHFLKLWGLGVTDKPNILLANAIVRQADKFIILNFCQQRLSNIKAIFAK